MHRKRRDDILPDNQDRNGPADSSTFIWYKQEITVVEHRKLFIEDDINGLPFLYLPAETGNSVRTCEKSIENVLSFAKLFWDVIGEGLYGKSVKRWYAENVSLQGIQEIYNIGGKCETCEALYSSNSEEAWDLTCGMYPDAIISRGSRNNQQTGLNVSRKTLLRHFQTITGINESMFYMWKYFTCFPHSVEHGNLTSISYVLLMGPLMVSM